MKPALLTFLPGQDIPGFDARLLVAHHADEYLALADGSARCSLWWTAAPPLAGERPGVIGHFAAASVEAGQSILAHAAERLRAVGRTIALGPMDGNTWRRYRVLTERDAEPPFFLEPDNPETWAAIFTGTGFTPLATYSSTLVADLTHRDPRADRAWRRLEGEGLTIRELDPARFEDDLRRIYEVSVAAFTGNFLYTELPEADFLAQYLPYREKIRPELILLAEDAGRPVGYLFAIPDFAEAQRGAPIRTVIGKTLAIKPGRRYGGLGVVLTDRLHARAAALGYQRLIHALQHEDNQVRNLSGAFGAVMRRYTLYARRLA